MKIRHLKTLEDLQKYYYFPILYASGALTTLRIRLRHLKFVPFTYLLTLTGRQTAEIDPHSRFTSINGVTDKQKSSCHGSPELSFWPGCLAFWLPFAVLRLNDSTGINMTNGAPLFIRYLLTWPPIRATKKKYGFPAIHVQRRAGVGTE